MVHKVSINFKSGNICCNSQSFRVYHGGRECCRQAKDTVSSCVHSLSSLALKHRRRASVTAKTWRSLIKKDVNPVLCFRLIEETWKCSRLKQVLPNAFISQMLFQFLLFFLLLFPILFLFLPFLSSYSSPHPPSSGLLPQIFA